MIWIITANTNSCRIFNYENKMKKLTLVTELNHAESRLKNIDLVSDRPGHYKSRGATRGAFSAHEEPREVEIENFSREIAKRLDAGKKTNQYATLILVALPHMIGLILQHLDHHTKACITADIKKDFTALTDREILEAIKSEGGLNPQSLRP